MADPVIFISRNRLRPGADAEFRRHYEASIEPIFQGKPRTLTQLAYADEAPGEVTVVRVFPDADALDEQIKGADERSRKTYEYIEPVGIELFGLPNAATLGGIGSIAGPGMTVRVLPDYLGGFIRHGRDGDR